MSFEFLTVKEFADKLKVQKEVVYMWISYGKIKAIRVSNKPKSPWRIPFTELKRMHASAYEIEEDE